MSKKNRGQILSSLNIVGWALAQPTLLQLDLLNLNSSGIRGTPYVFQRLNLSLLLKALFQNRPYSLQ